MAKHNRSDKELNMVLKPVFQITNDITKAITAIERARGFLEGATLSPDWVRDMQDRAFVLEAHHTTHIEGTHLTFDQSKQILAGQVIENTNKEDVKELLNYQKAFEMLACCLDSGVRGSPCAHTSPPRGSGRGSHSAGSTVPRPPRAQF